MVLNQSAKGREWEFAIIKHHLGLNLPWEHILKNSMYLKEIQKVWTSSWGLWIEKIRTKPRGLSTTKPCQWLLGSVLIFLANMMTIIHRMMLTSERERQYIKREISSWYIMIIMFEHFGFWCWIHPGFIYVFACLLACLIQRFIISLIRLFRREQEDTHKQRNSASCHSPLES